MKIIVKHKSHKSAINRVVWVCVCAAYVFRTLPFILLTCNIVILSISCKQFFFIGVDLTFSFFLFVFAFIFIFSSFIVAWIYQLCVIFSPFSSVFFLDSWFFAFLPFRGVIWLFHCFHVTSNPIYECLMFIYAFLHLFFLFFFFSQSCFLLDEIN